MYDITVPQRASAAALGAAAAAGLTKRDDGKGEAARRAVWRTESMTFIQNNCLASRFVRVILA